LWSNGHRVVLHARDGERREDARRELPEADAVVVRDLSIVRGSRSVAEQVKRALCFPDVESATAANQVQRGLNS
jgi:hypothetical protein